MYSQRGRDGQFGEDDYLLTIFGDTPGRFLDIGAADGKTFSNTYAFVELGWSGVYVEPSCYQMSNLLDTIQKLPHDAQERLKRYQFAVGPERGIRPMSVTRDLLSTFDEEHREEWKDTVANCGNPYQYVWMEIITIKDLLVMTGPQFDLVSIDAEGLSGDIFVQFFQLQEPWKFEEIRPKAVVVEHNGKRLTEFSLLAHHHGYFQGWIGGENVIFVRR
jgi:hypothetical protein